MTRSSHNLNLKGLLLTVSFSILLVIVFVTSEAVASNGKASSPILILNSDNHWVDFNWDGLSDYYVKAHNTGKENKVYKVDYKFIDQCVDGSTHDEAVLKIGFSKYHPSYNDYYWLSDGFEAWTNWFKSSKADANNKIDLVDLPLGKLPIPFPTSGEDVIIKNENDKNGSFSHKNSIKQLDGQSGWEGSIYFHAPHGEYIFWTIHPAQGIAGCDIIAAVGIPIIIKD